MRSGLESARKDLQGGNLQKAISSFGRAKLSYANNRAAEVEGLELKELEQDVRRAQGSNLIAAQNSYFYDNAGKLGFQQMQQQQTPSQASQSGSLFLNYDANVAGLDRTSV